MTLMSTGSVSVCPLLMEVSYGEDRGLGRTVPLRGMAARLETVQNRYLEMVQSKERVDLRSYERQGVDVIPTVHMGPAVAEMERRGVQTNIGVISTAIYVL